MFNRKRKKIAELYAENWDQFLEIKKLKAECYNYRDKILSLSPPDDSFYYKRCKYLEKQLKILEDKIDILRGYLSAHSYNIMERGGFKC